MKKIVILLVFLIGCGAVNKSKVADNVSLYGDYLKVLEFERQGKFEDALALLDKILKQDQDEYLVLKKGEILIEEEKFEEAKKWFLKYAPKYKSDRLYYKLSQLYRIKFKDLNSAAKYLEKAIELNPKESYYYELANIYEMNKNYSKAISIYDKLIKENPSSEYYYRRGVLYLKLGLEKGIKDIKKAYEIDGYPLALYKLTDYYLKKGDNKKSLELLEKLLKAHPNQQSLLFKMGRILVEEKQYDRAIKIFKKLANSDNDFIKAAAYKQLAAIYFDKKEYKKALDCFYKVIEIKDDDTQAYYFAGYISEILGNDDEALKNYEKALELDKDYTQVRKRMALIYMKKKEFDKALRLLDGIKKDFIDSDYYRLKALVYHEKGDYEKALEILKEGEQNGFDDEELLFDMVINYEKLKKYKMAEKYLKKILDINPRNASALNFLGYMWAEKGENLEEAYKLIKKALEIEPDNPAYIDSMGWVLFQMKKYEDAYRYLKRAFILSPDEPEIREHMEKILKIVSPEKTLDNILNEKN